MLIAIIIGAISGWIASIIMNSKSGLLRDIFLGIIGWLLGSFIFDKLGISFAGYLGEILVSVVGACIIILVVDKIFK